MTYSRIIPYERRSAFLLEKNTLHFLPLGGSGEIGMNLNLYAYNGKWLMVDLGVSFESIPGVEVVMPDIKGFEPYIDQLVGLVLTHAHEDHIGAVAYFWDRLRCPLFATPFTATILRHKLKEWNVKAPVHEVPLSGKVDLNPFQVEFISLTHSIPEPNALAIRTPAGVVLHTGDWKIDPDPLIGEVTDENSLKKLGDEGVLALVCDSTSIFEKGHSGSEAQVRKSLIELVGKYPHQRVIIACFASNVARLATCAEVARVHGRHVAMVGRSLDRMDQAARGCGYFEGVSPFLTERDVADLPRHKALLVCTGSQGEPRAALMRIAGGQHPHVQLEEGDVVIFSSRIIPGNEKAIHALQNQLVRAGVRVLTHKEADMIHVSGHPSRDELKQMYAWTRPQIALPVHGEDRHLKAHAEFARELGVPQAFAPRNGQIIRLSASKGVTCVGEVPTGRLALDGRKLVPFFGAVMHDRHRLMAGGLMQVSVALTLRGKLKDLKISLLGIVEKEEEAALLLDLEEAITVALSELPLEARSHDETVSEALRLAGRRLIYNQRGKKPLVTVHLLRVG